MPAGPAGRAPRSSRRAGGPGASGFADRSFGERSFSAGGRKTRSNSFDDGWNKTAPLAPQPGGRRGTRGKAVIVDGEANLIRSGGDSLFKQGDPVRHAKFGKGVVKRAEGDKLTVIFEGVGAKKVVATFVERA